MNAEPEFNSQKILHPAVTPAHFGYALKGVKPTDFHLRWLISGMDRRIKRQLILAPRESAKTTWMAEILPLWWIGRYPLDSNFLGSVSDAQAHDRLSAIRLVIENNPVWRRVFPHIRPDKRRGWSHRGLHVWDTRYSYDEWIELVSKQGELKSPTIVAGGAGGAGAIGMRVTGLCIIDDIHDDKNSATELLRDKAQNWLFNTVANTVTRAGKLILINTRWNRDDVPGRIIATNEVKKIWDVSIIQAITENGESYWPEHWPLWRLDEKRGEIGTVYFRAQYMNDPRGLAGDIINIEWFEQRPEQLPEFKRLCVSVDLAISKSDVADFTAISILARDKPGNLYILDIRRGKWSFNEAQREIIKMCAKARILYKRLDRLVIEKMHYDSAVVEELLRKTDLPAMSVKPAGDKIARAMPWIARLEQGMVYIDKNAASWEMFADECVVFSEKLNENDDMIDTISQGHRYLLGRKALGRGTLPKTLANFKEHAAGILNTRAYQRSSELEVLARFKRDKSTWRR